MGQGEHAADSAQDDREIIEELVARLSDLGRRRQGLATLRRGMLRLARFCADNGTSLVALTLDEAKAYRHELVESGLAPSSVRNLLNAGSSLCTALVRSGVRFDNPFRSIQRSGTVQSLPRTMLKETEWGKVLGRLARFGGDASFRERQEWYRAHVLTEFLYATGMRVGEAALLAERDLDLEDRNIRVREGKGGRERIAFLSDYSCRTLALFLSVRPVVIHRSFGHRERLFGMSEANLSHFISTRLASACLAEGFPPVTAHGIRHMVGWHLLRSGCPLRAIQGILGHLQMRSTEIYTRVDKESLKRVIDRYHPRSGAITAEEGREPTDGMESPRGALAG